MSIQFRGLLLVRIRELMQHRSMVVCDLAEYDQIGGIHGDACGKCWGWRSGVVLPPEGEEEVEPFPGGR
jgi:hypothetical protein